MYHGGGGGGLSKSLVPATPPRRSVIIGAKTKSAGQVQYSMMYYFMILDD